MTKLKEERLSIIEYFKENSLMVNIPPEFDGLIDDDIADRFIGSSVTWGDIINAQLIKTNRELTEAIKLDEKK